jgi:uncharacterized damage-inducible protein DinB
MRTRADLALAVLEQAHQMLAGNVQGVALEEALSSGGGYRSILGILKHTAAWSHVYHSYAFDSTPRHWQAIDWPRGLKDTVDTSQAYLDEIRSWYEDSYGLWTASVKDLADEEFDQPRPCHWGGTLPLFEIVLMATNHWVYHAGELNAILSVLRGEAWEYREEVEENHISTAGHRVKPDWMTDDEVVAYEAALAKRDEELHPSTHSRL